MSFQVGKSSEKNKGQKEEQMIRMGVVPTRPKKPKPMVWTCRFCNSATPMNENLCRECGAPR